MNDFANNKTDNILGLIGIARRAGKVAFGFDAVIKDISKGAAKGVFLSVDASERTAANVKGYCEKYGIKLTKLHTTKATLGAAIGRHDTAVIAVLDRNLSEKIAGLAESANNNTA